MKAAFPNLENPIVSVIIPTHNRAEILKRAIQSALDQTFTDFELIVIDDASTDKTGEMISNLQDPRIKYLRHESNMGGAVARNSGIRSAKGKYIAFLDSDDEWLPEKLKKQIQLFNDSPKIIGAVYTGLTVRSKDNAVVSHRVPEYSGDLRAALFAKNCIGPLSSVMVRKDCLDDSGLFDEVLPSCQDWDLFIQIAEFHHFAFIEDPLVTYYLSDDSITSNTESKAAGHKMILHKYYIQIKKNRKALSQQHLTIGHYLCRSGRVQDGRKEFLRAALSNGFSIKIFLFLFFSLLGPGMYQRAVALRNRGESI